MASPTTKGIILAGGSGTRLYPVTLALSKQLVPIYNKPMVYYPLSTLMLAGIRQVLVISSPQDIDGFRRLLGDGVFYGHGFTDSIQRAAARTRGATVFAYWVRDPQRYGVVEFDAAGHAVGLEEKPLKPRSPWAVTGLYFYDNRVVDIAASLKPSARGELEITDVNLAYLEAGELHVERLGRGIAWLDTGTHEALLQASSFIQTLEERQGLMVACVEEIAFRMGYITAEHVLRLASPMSNNSYGEYLRRLVDGRPHGSR